MPSNECMPVFEPSTRPTGYCTAAVRGCRLVAVSGDIPGGLFGTENIQVAECGAGVAAVAVACYDGAQGDNIALVRVGLLPLVAGVVNIAAGLPLMSDAQGRVVPWVTGNHKVGVSVSASVAVGDTIGVALQV